MEKVYLTNLLQIYYDSKKTISFFEEIQELPLLKPDSSVFMVHLEQVIPG